MESSTKASRLARKKRLEALKGLEPDELRVLHSYAREQLSRWKEAKDAGKPKTLTQIRKEIDSALPEVEGINDVNTRSIPRWQRMELIPGERLRPGATKMVLRPEEEAELPLERMGHGNIFKPRQLFGQNLPCKRDFAWGIFARPDAVQRALQKQWSRLKTTEVLNNEMFYLDVLRHCHQMELTLMLLTSRPLPLAEAQQKLEKRLREGVDNLTGGNISPADESDIKKFVHLFDEKKLQRYDIVSNGAVREGTHLLFSTTPSGELVVEAITPGPIRDRKGYKLGTSRNPFVTGGVFEMFLGLRPLDPLGKQMVGTNLVWCSNGFRLTKEGSPTQFQGVCGTDGLLRFPQPESATWMDLSLDVFKMAEEKIQPVRSMLLDGIRSAKDMVSGAEQKL